MSRQIMLEFDTLNSANIFKTHCDNLSKKSWGITKIKDVGWKYVFAICGKSGEFRQMLVLDEDQVINLKEPEFLNENEDGTYLLMYENEQGTPCSLYFLEQFLI